MSVCFDCALVLCFVKGYVFQFGKRIEKKITQRSTLLLQSKKLSLHSNTAHCIHTDTTYNNCLSFSPLIQNFKFINNKEIINSVSTSERDGHADGQ